MVSGPTGALLSHALDNDTTAVGFIVESDPQFPDPDAAKAVIEGGIQPLADMEISTADLVDKAKQIEQARQKLLSQMQQATEESSRAEPIRMYQ
jgi:uncharacterized protein